jgi:hypothetical protein
VVGDLPARRAGSVGMTNELFRQDVCWGGVGGVGGGSVSGFMGEGCDGEVGTIMIASDRGRSCATRRYFKSGALVLMVYEYGRPIWIGFGRMACRADRIGRV